MVAVPIIMGVPVGATEARAVSCVDALYDTSLGVDIEIGRCAHGDPTNVGASVDAARDNGLCPHPFSSSPRSLRN